MGHPQHQLKKEFESVIKYIYGPPLKEIPEILTEFGYAYSSEPIPGYQLAMEKFVSGTQKITINLSSNGVGTMQRISLRNPVLNLAMIIVETISALFSAGSRVDENQIQFQYQSEVKNS